MQLTAKIDQILTPITGESKNGKWKKQDVVVDTISNISKKICFTLWGEKIDTSLLKIGATVNFHFDLESKENKGKWFTNIKVCKIESVGTVRQVESISAESVEPQESMTPYNFLDDSNDEILPF